MKKMQLLNFQYEAVSSGIKYLNKYDKKFILQSPTGTGKTFMAANLINKFIENSKTTSFEKVTFLHFSPSKGSLYQQNYEKFEEYNKLAGLNSYKTNLISKTNLNIDVFEKDNVYFFGWDSITKKTNVLTSKQERKNFWDVLKHTLDEGIKLFLIIDEAHLRFNNKNSETEKFIKSIFEKHKDIFDYPPYEFKMSATLKEKKENYTHIITYSDAVKEEIVKRNIIINSTDELSKDFINSDNELIYSAIKKREEIVKEYDKKKLNRKYNYPLVIIQLTDKKTTNKDEEDKVERILRILEKYNIHKKHIAVWLSGRHEILYKDKNEKKLNDKELKEYIKNKSDIQFLIFKQAVATGWDIPRANIWVKLRNNMKDSFEVQTLGRVLRNQFHRYYNNELIDNAFIYTNDKDTNLKICETFGKNNTTYKEYKKEIVYKKKNISENKIDRFTIKEPVEIKEHNIDIKKFSNDFYNANKDIFDEEFKRIKKNKDLKNWKQENIIRNARIKTTSKNLFGKFDSKIKESENLNQMSLEEFLPPSNHSLLKRFLLFKNKIGNETVFNILNNIIVDFSLKNKFDNFIKKAYRYFYLKFTENKNYKDLYSLIYTAYSKLIIKNTDFDEQEFIFNDKTEIFDFYLDLAAIGKKNFDNINLYNIKFRDKIFDSLIETAFYAKLENDCEFNDKFKYGVYNDAKDQNALYIKYLDSNFKYKRYYPDFIISFIDKVFILDTKDKDFYYKNIQAFDATINEIKNKKLYKNNKKNIEFGYVYPDYTYNNQSDSQYYKDIRFSSEWKLKNTFENDNDKDFFKYFIKEYLKNSI